MKFLSFEICQETYGIQLSSVREVIAFNTFTKIPNMPNHFLGIMNLRDKVIPLMDARICLGLIPTLTSETSVIICAVKNTLIGIVVDCIFNVINPSDNEIISVGSQIEEVSGVISNVIKIEKGLVLILDIDNFVKADPQTLQNISVQTSSLNLKAS